VNGTSLKSTKRYCRLNNNGVDDKKLVACCLRAAAAVIVGSMVNAFVRKKKDFATAPASSGSFSNTSLLLEHSLQNNIVQ
jgi:hypothetical protein